MKLIMHLYTYFTYILVANATLSPQNETSNLPQNRTILPELPPIIAQINQIQTEALPLIKEVQMEAEKIMKADLSAEIPAIRQEMLKMPDPWPITDIKPRLIFFKHNIPPLELPYNTTPGELSTKLLNAGFLDSSRLVLITHGFHNDITIGWLTTFKDLIINASAPAKYDQTVALVGWGGGADILIFRYRQAAANVNPVGLWLAPIVKAINGLKPKLDIYGIGHSLGAHVMGIAARTSGVFTRITGLDPAGPCFESVKDSPTLYKTDAPFVDVIHTDGYDSRLDPEEWFFPVNHYGSLVPIGTFDFYPNYGYHQPGAGTFTVAGSHLRALDLFAWSILNPGKLVTSDLLARIPAFDDPVTKSIPGNYTVEMGYYADRSKMPPKNANTTFYIKTNPQVPWV